ncbi:hypothetical protein [Oceanobacillus rekensis]|uniref:hypothetical protein n=1 Tax=Oceanobacillus rekensis TaxID=937927 RepID=UPI000B42E41E|nr:hypothetical protein [Oceanobacillus rekensis]
MDIIESYKIQLQDKLHTEEILDLHQIASHSNSNIYLYRKHMIADAENLPKLLSFFLTTEADETFTLINDGEMDKKNQKNLINFLKQKPINILLKDNYDASKNESIVIV